MPAIGGIKVGVVVFCRNCFCSNLFISSGFVMMRVVGSTLIHYKIASDSLPTSSDVLSNPGE